MGDQKVEVWLIDYRRYYERTSLYGDNNQAYGDNGERYAFLAAAALDAAYRLEFQPDIVHSNDWHAALAPMILRFKYGSNPFFDKTRSVITIHNGAFQGVFDRGQISFIPEIASYYNDMIMQGSYINFLKCGVFFADKINTVSPGYAQELTTYLGGHGMAKNFQDRAQDLVGIINGCDYSDWDPATDKHLKINYDLDTMEEKILGKYLLQRKLGLPMGDDPLYGMVARLTDRGEILDDGTVHPFDAAQAHLWALWLIERHGPPVPGASHAWTGPDGMCNTLIGPDADATGMVDTAARASGQPLVRVWFADQGEPPHRMCLARA